MTNKIGKFGPLSSSTDPEKLAATVTGVLISSASLLAWGLTSLIGLPVTAQQVATNAGQIGTAIGSVWFLFGLLRKGIVFFTTKISKTE